MKSVLYLCLNNELNKVGLIFPDELKEDFYSPGSFIIETKDIHYTNQKEKFYNEYLFLGVEEGKIVKHILEYKENNKFVVKTEKRGNIKFEAIYVPKPINKYVGKKKNFYHDKYSHFYVLKCEEIEELENMCREHDFYFVGSVFDENTVDENRN